LSRTRVDTRKVKMWAGGTANSQHEHGGDTEKKSGGGGAVKPWRRLPGLLGWGGAYRREEFPEEVKAKQTSL